MAEFFFFFLIIQGLILQGSRKVACICIAAALLGLIGMLYYHATDVLIARL